MKVNNTALIIIYTNGFDKFFVEILWGISLPREAFFMGASFILNFIYLTLSLILGRDGSVQF